MTSLRKTDYEPSKAIRWPRQLITPTKLVQSLSEKSSIRLMKSPLCSKIVLQFVGSWSYLLAHVLNKTRVLNFGVIKQEIKRNEDFDQERLISGQDHCPRSPLLTISNHISCIDDPVLWASLLPLTYYSRNTDTVRWSPAAIEICFSKSWHSTFFALGKTFPIMRGVGVRQPAIEFALALLNCNQWLHLFPEGRVMRDNNQQVISNRERGYLFKWGVSKLIMDYLGDTNKRDKTLRLLPFYHLGLDEILPIGWPYIPSIGKQISICIKPSVIEMNSKLLGDIFANRSLVSIDKARSDEEINRIKLTNYLEEEVEKLCEPTKILHNSK